MAKIIPGTTIDSCEDCPFIIDGGVVEDICGKTEIYIYHDAFRFGSNFPYYCPLVTEEIEGDTNG
jgi:hypothetical protein